MSFCEVLLAAGLIQAANCETLPATQAEALQPSDSVVVSESWSQDNAGVLVERRYGRSTGFTLRQVADDVVWRQSAFDEMVRND